MKTEQEQIEEIAKTMCEEFRTDTCRFGCPCMNTCANKDISERLYSAGYRKASDVIDEFVERLKLRESPKLLTWEYGEGYSDCIKIAEQLAAEMRQEVEKCGK